MAWLLFQHSVIDYSQQQSTLRIYSEKYPEIFEYSSLAAGNEVMGRYRSRAPATHLAARSRHRVLDTFWQMSSYTALSSLSLKEVPELPQDKVQESEQIDIPEAIEDQLPKGAHTGNVVHELLERTDFKTLSKGENISSIRDRYCLRYGLALEDPKVLDVLLKKVVQTPLSLEASSFILANIDESKCLKEMPFYLSMVETDVQKINSILKDSPAFQPLSAKRMQGHLTGFIDLVCEFKGRWTDGAVVAAAFQAGPFERGFRFPDERLALVGPGIEPERYAGIGRGAFAYPDFAKDITKHGMSRVAAGLRL